MIEQLLNNLSNAYSNQNWEECSQLLEHLFLHLDRETCKKLSLKYVINYFNDFGENHPNRIWIEDILIEIERAISQQLNLSDLLIDDVILKRFDSPGWPNFIVGLEALWDTTNPELNIKEVAIGTSFSIANIIMAHMDKIWGERNLEVWIRVRYRDNEIYTEQDIVDSNSLLQDKAALNFGVYLWEKLHKKLRKILIPPRA